MPRSIPGPMSAPLGFQPRASWHGLTTFRAAFPDVDAPARSPAVAPAGHTRSGGSALQGELLTGHQALDGLRAEWEAALARMAAPSVFITPEFIEATLRHRLGPDETPWFVVVRRQRRLVGLLPLVRGRTVFAGLPITVLQHAGAISGDRPGLVCDADPAEVWPVLIDTLMAHRHRWHLLDLREIDEGCCLLDDDGCLQRVAQRHALPIRREVWTHAGCLPLSGSWDDYLAARSRNARQSLRRRERLLFANHPDAHIEVIDQPAQIGAAFDRYLAIEAKGWKSAAAVGLWSDLREQALYRDLLPRLAASGRASVWLLRAGGHDMAGLVRLRQGRILYERHAAFDPDHATYSPSTYLCMEAVRQSFGSDCTESDVLGMPEPLEARPAIHPWYPQARRTWRVTLLNLPWYLRPLAWLKASLSATTPAG